MSFESFTSADIFKAGASLVTGGAIAGWFREHRKAKKDAQSFALEFMREQSQRIDKLVTQVAQLEADHIIASKALELSREQVHDLRGEVGRYRMEILVKDQEITRLKTALGEHRRGDITHD